MVEQQVPGRIGRRRAAEHQDRAQPAARRGGRGLAAVVRLRRAERHERIGPARERIPDEQLELAHLIAAAGESRQVVALDEDLRSAQGAREPGEKLDRSGERGQGDAGQSRSHRGASRP